MKKFYDVDTQHMFSWLIWSYGHADQFKHMQEMIYAVDIND